MGQWFWHLALFLGTFLLVSVGTLFVLHFLRTPPFLWGVALFEVTAWTHSLAALTYAGYLRQRIYHFSRPEVLPDLLLTGVPPFWLATARLLYPLLIQGYLAVLCLPFYAAAVSLGGYPWGTPLLAITLILVLGLPSRMRRPSQEDFLPSRLLLTTLLVTAAVYSFFMVFRFAFWSSLPLLLSYPVRIYSASVPFGVLLVVGVLGYCFSSVLQEAWRLEPRFYPTQSKLKAWLDHLQILEALFWLGIFWAYFTLAPDFQSKFAFSLAALWWHCSFRLHEANYYPLQNPFHFALKANAAGLLLWALVGIETGVPFRDLILLVAKGGVLALIQAFSFQFSYGWWEKLTGSSNSTPPLGWLLFLVWLVAPLALFVPPFAPLAAIQGWLVPLSLLPSSLVQKGTAYLPFGLRISLDWTINLGSWQLSLPLWVPMMVAQLLWSLLLRRVAQLQLAKGVTKEERRECFTPDHLLWGWLVRMEECWCERWQNPLVNLQLRWQRRFDTLANTLTAQLVLLVLLVGAVLSTVFHPHPDWVAFVRATVERLPYLSGLVALLIMFGVLRSLESKMALWELGRKRVIEQFVLAPINEKQWLFGFWFPRFWLQVKAILPCVVAIWFGVVLAPEWGKALVALLITFSLLVVAAAWSMAVIASNLMSFGQWFIWTLLTSSLLTVTPTCLFLLALLGSERLIGATWMLLLLGHLLSFPVHMPFFLRLKKLRQPCFYDQWLALTEARARQVAQWREIFGAS